jgi:hypothetical protein
MRKRIEAGKLWTIIGAIIPLISLIYFLIDRYFQGKIYIEINNEQVATVPIYGINKQYNGALALTFYDIKIKNLTRKTKTIKSVELQYEYNGEVYTIDSFVMPPMTDVSGREYITVHNSKGYGSVRMLSWKNLRTEINKFEPIMSEGILSASAVYILNSCKPSDFNKVREVKFLITDSKDKIYKQPFKLNREYYNYIEKGFFLERGKN